MSFPETLSFRIFTKVFFCRMPGRKEGAEQISRFLRCGPLVVRQRKPRQTQFLFPFIQQFLQRPFLSSPFPPFRRRKKKSLKVRIAAERTEERGKGKKSDNFSNFFDVVREGKRAQLSFSKKWLFCFLLLPFQSFSSSLSSSFLPRSLGGLSIKADSPTDQGSAAAVPKDRGKY